MNYKKRIKERGLKIIWIADKLGISQPLLSMYLSGDRTMSEEIESKLKDILR